MTPSYSVKRDARRYRYYVSQTKLRGEVRGISISRVPAPALEDIIIGVLTRLQLPTGGAHEASPARSVLGRVHVKANSLAIELDRDGALQWWKAHTPHAARMSVRDLISALRGRLGASEVLSNQEEHLILTMPVRAHFRGGRAAILPVPGSAAHRSRPDSALIKALARAHRWKQMLIGGEVDSVEALSAQVGQERRHAGRTLALAFLSPELTSAILKGEQPPGLRLAHLLDVDIPLSWREQRKMFERITG